MMMILSSGYLSLRRNNALRNTAWKNNFNTARNNNAWRRKVLRNAVNAVELHAAELQSRIHVAVGGS